MVMGAGGGYDPPNVPILPARCVGYFVIMLY